MFLSIHKTGFNFKQDWNDLKCNEVNSKHNKADPFRVRNLNFNNSAA